MSSHNEVRDLIERAVAASGDRGLPAEVLCRLVEEAFDYTSADSSAVLRGLLDTGRLRLGDRLRLVI